MTHEEMTNPSSLVVCYDSGPSGGSEHCPAIEDTTPMATMMSTGASLMLRSKRASLIYLLNAGVVLVLSGAFIGNNKHVRLGPEEGSLAGIARDQLGLQSVDSSIGNVVVDPDDANPSLISSSSSSSRKNDTSTLRFSNWPTSRRRGMTGSWIGNSWIPPSPWKYYSAHEMRQLYQEKGTLWIGDSTARRASMTLHGILNTQAHTNHTSVESINRGSVIDINKYSVVENCTLWPDVTHEEFRPSVCRPFPQGPGHLSFLRLNCTKSVEEFFRSELEKKSTWTNQVDLVVLGLGIWEAVRPRQCTDNRTKLERQSTLIDLAARLAQQRNITIVWRTCGFATDRAPGPVRGMNMRAMDQIDQLAAVAGSKNRLTYVDWSGAIEARSFGPERIAGDISAHYGLEPRIVMAQMLTNHLVDIGFFGNNMPSVS